MGALYELAEQAGAAPIPADTAGCPQCAAPMAGGAVLCTACGFDLRTGKKLAAASAPKPGRAVSPTGRGSKGKAVDRMAPQGSFAAGFALCAAFALAASILWVAVAWATGYAIGHIAILIGGAAGAGMKIGHKGFSSAGGAAAAGMTLVAILLAKLVVIELIISSHGSHASISNIDSTVLAAYFFSPIGLVIMCIGMAAAFRTASGSVKG
jgi:hypothetical protein